MRPRFSFPCSRRSRPLKGVGPRVAPLLEKVAGPLVRDVLFADAAEPGAPRARPRPPTRRDGEEQTFDRHHRGAPAARPRRPCRGRSAPSTTPASSPWSSSAASARSLEQAHPKGARADRQRPGRAQRLRPRAADRPPGLPLAPPSGPTRCRRSRRSIRRPRACRRGRVRRFALEALERAPALPEWQDAAWLARQRWPAWREALEALHHPQGEADLSPQSPARRRLAFDELLAHQLALAQRKAARRAEPARAIAGQRPGRQGRGRPAVPPDRRAGPLPGRDPRRPGLRRADEPAGPGRRRLGQDRGRDAGDGRRRRAPACSRR